MSTNIFNLKNFTNTFVPVKQNIKLIIIMHSKQKGTFPTTPRILAAFLMAFFLMVSCGCSTKIGQPVLPDSEGNGSETETPDENKPDDNKPDDNKPGENEQTPDSEGYVLMWSDEFDSNSLDTGKWRIEVNGNGGGNAELQYYDESGISLGKDSEYGNSALKITARREQRNGKAFVSGRLNTSNSAMAKWREGYVFHAQPMVFGRHSGFLERTFRPTRGHVAVKSTLWKWAMRKASRTAHRTVSSTELAIGDTTKEALIPIMRTPLRIPIAFRTEITTHTR